MLEQYAFSSQAMLHDLDPAETLIPLAPRPGEFTLRTEDIIDAIKQHGDSLAVVLFSGVQYYTGQCFEMEQITKAAQAQVGLARDSLVTRYQGAYRAPWSVGI
jgi:kynureninase